MTQIRVRTKIRVSPPELHTLLAALRYYQAHGQGDVYNRPAWIDEIATDSGRVNSALDERGIDRLCARLNRDA